MDLVSYTKLSLHSQPPWLGWHFYSSNKQFRKKLAKGLFCLTLLNYVNSGRLLQVYSSVTFLWIQSTIFTLEEKSKSISPHWMTEKASFSYWSRILIAFQLIDSFLMPAILQHSRILKPAFWLGMTDVLRVTVNLSWDKALSPYS